MKLFCKYLKTSYKFVDETEFVEFYGGKLDANVNTLSILKSKLKPNGFCAYMPAEDQPIKVLTKEELAMLSRYGDIEYIQLGNDNTISYLFKKCITNIDWYDEKTNEISFPQIDDTTELSEIPLYKRLLPTNYNLESIDVIRIISVFICEYKKPYMYEETGNASLKILPKRACTKKTVYLEYGVGKGGTLFAIAPFVHLAYGIDKNGIPPSFHQNIERITTNDTTSFNQLHLPTLKYQFVYINCESNAKNVYQTFVETFEHLETGGYIFIHNTFPCHEWLLADQYCGDCYKVPIKIKKEYSDKIQIITLPLNPGLTIVRKI